MGHLVIHPLKTMDIEELQAKVNQLVKDCAAKGDHVQKAELLHELEDLESSIHQQMETHRKEANNAARKAVQQLLAKMKD